MTEQETRGKNFALHFKRGKSDTWLTPKWVTDALGEFDLDHVLPKGNHGIMLQLTGLRRTMV